jgi:hypothetical protein
LALLFILIVIIDDLHVGNNNYDGDNILIGWHEHFQNLAQPADDPSYNNQYKQQCQTDYELYYRV